MSQLLHLRRLVLDRVIAVTSHALVDFTTRSWEQQGGSRSQLHTLVESFTAELRKDLPIPQQSGAFAAAGGPQHVQLPSPPGRREDDACAAADAGVLVFDFSNAHSANSGAACASHQQQSVTDWDDAHGREMGGLYGGETGGAPTFGSRRNSDDFRWDEVQSIKLHPMLAQSASLPPPLSDPRGGSHEDEALAAAAGATGRAPDSNLPLLNLTHFDVSNCLKIASLDSVFAASRRLTHVNLSGCPNLSSASVGILGISCGAELRHVNLSGCHNVTDTGVQALAARCGGLRSLLLNKCRNAVNDETLRAIAACCPELVRLGINSCVHVSDHGMGHIGCMANLSHLDIEFCHTVTDAGLEHVLNGCSQLQDVNMRMLSHLTAATMHFIGSHWPHLRRVRVGGVDTPANLAGLMKPAMNTLPKGQLHVSW